MAGLADPYAPLSRGMPMLLLDDAYGRLFVDYNHIYAGGQCGDVHALGVAVFAGYACYFGAVLENTRMSRIASGLVTVTSVVAGTG